MAEEQMQNLNFSPEDLAGQERRNRRKDQAAAFASWLNSMSIRPDPNLPAQLQAARAARVEDLRKNRTVNMLKQAGQTELANLVKAGTLDAKSAASQMFQLAAEERQFARQKELQKTTQLSSDQRLFNLYKQAYPDKTDAEILQMAMKQDDKLPTTFRSLDMTARAAGFVPKDEGGDGRYEDFMAGQGAGFKQAAKNLANLNFEQLSEYGKVLEKAERTTKLIDQIKIDPNLEGVLGRVEGKIPISSWGSLLVFNQDETDLVQLIDNLENSVFLEAFQLLKGGGQITELEGEKAQRAIVNLSRDRSRGAFVEALNTLQSVINSGLNRAQKGVTADNPYTKDLVVSRSATQGDGKNTSPKRQKYDAQGNLIDG